MALTGLLLCGFLVAHLAGNLLIFDSSDAFNSYAKALEENPLLPLAEMGLLALFALHIATGLWVWAGSRGARGGRYAVRASAGGSSWGSATMIASGVLLAAFVVVHVRTFRFAEDRSDLYELVLEAFRSRPYALFYVAAMAALALHLSHGFQSAFQTLGASHPRLTPALRGFGWLFAAGVAAGFASIPLWAGFFQGCCG